MAPFSTVAEIAVDRATALVYEEGWQSWSPTNCYAVGQAPHRPHSEVSRLMNYRSDKPSAPPWCYQGEGLLAVLPAAGRPVHVFASPWGADPIASIRAVFSDTAVVITADGPVSEEIHPSADPRADGRAAIAAALGQWADRWVAGHRGALREAPTAWCSWYHYRAAVTEADIDENLAAIDELALPIDVVQIDDGYQAGVGDWLRLSPRFTSLAKLADRIRDRGYRAGIWLAPFLVGADSRLAAEHPDWLVPAANAGYHWAQELYGLDTANPAAQAYLHEVFATLSGMGFDYFKLDFCYAGALPGPRHDRSTAQRCYRSGLGLIREAVGPAAYLLGCGAPILPSVGLFDAMRVSPDTSSLRDISSDLGQPSQQSAMVTGAARAWQHGRFWVNDPDCIMAAPEVVDRAQWAAHIARYGGLRASSDRLRNLDAWGVETTRRLLTERPAPTPFPV